METDINRLEQVALGNFRGRGCGKTFLICHNIAGTLEVGNKNKVVAITSSKRDINYILPMLLEILKEHHLPVIRYRRQLQSLSVGNKEVIFITDKELYKLDGIDANIVFIRHED